MKRSRCDSATRQTEVDAPSGPHPGACTVDELSRPCEDKSGGDGAASEELCVVCFEVSQRVSKLPCHCKVSYCVGCWDRCLAQSFNACGQARCPTCRWPVRVDFDTANGCMLFSRDLETDEEPEEEAEEEEEDDEAADEDAEAQSAAGLPGRGGAEGPAPRGSRRRSPRAAREERSSRARNRLIEQARPAQVQLLRSYAQAAPTAARGPPRCACGGVLERLTAEERVRRVFGRQLPLNLHGTVTFEQIVARVLNEGISICSCDLCGRSIEPPNAVWTCQNGNRTILHANAYDVCEACFQQHTTCGLEAAGAEHGATAPLGTLRAEPNSAAAV